MKIIGIIPARMASTRFPNKPLIDILGKSMIQRTYEQAIQYDKFDEVIVATDHQDIFDAVLTFGGKVVMTSTTHQNGTERIAEVAQSFSAEDIIINIQGDEPFFEPLSLENLITCFEQKKVQIATLIKAIENENDLISNTVIKVTKSLTNKALYFSRSKIPYTRQVEKDNIYWKHIGIYAFRNKTLQQLVKLEETPFEKMEKLEQLRWLENDYEIHLGITTHESNSVDTPEDLKQLLAKKSKK